MADTMRLRRQALLRAWKTGCQAPERTNGQSDASPVRLGNCCWAEYFDPTACDPSSCPAVMRSSRQENHRMAMKGRALVGVKRARPFLVLGQPLGLGRASINFCLR